jgi:hypothetical protein
MSLLAQLCPVFLVYELTVIVGGCKAEERSDAAVIYFEFLLQRSPEGKERETEKCWCLTCQSVGYREHWPSEHSSIFRNLPVKECMD